MREKNSKLTKFLHTFVNEVAKRLECETPVSLFWHSLKRECVFLLQRTPEKRNRSFALQTLRDLSTNSWMRASHQTGTVWLLPFVTALLFFTYASAWSLPPQGSLDLGRAYFEAGDYSHAKIVYEGLLDDRLAPWKKDILNYNIATSLLADGKWDEAALAFEVLADKNIPLPLLKQRVLSNLSLAKIEQLESRLASLNENAKLTHEDYNLLYVQFREILADIGKADSAACALEKIEGAENCPESLYLQEMRLEIKNRFNQFLKDYLTFRLTHLSLQEGVSALLIGEKSLLGQLEVFQGTNFSSGLQEKYLANYLNQGESWKPLWEQFAETLKSKSKEADFTGQRDAFEKSRKLFLDSLALAEKGEFQDSTTKLESSYKGLNALLREFISVSSAREVLHQLLITYGLALVKSPIQKVPLEQILAIQTALEPVIGKDVSASLLGQYEKAQNYLKQSVKSLEESHSVKARLFAEVARFYVQGILEQIDFTPKTLATTVLENVIAKQEFILLLNKLRDQVHDGEKGLEEIDHLIAELQVSTLEAAARFPEVVLARQEEAFRAKGNAAMQCQCQPWDEVIPLFSEGYSKAQLAGIYLNTGDFIETSVQRLQKSAIESWKEALVKMRSKSASNKESKQEEQKPEDQPQNQDQSKDQKEQNAKLNEILRMVQEMENDDRSMPQQVKTLSGSTKGEERPW